jgi:hypothetical protein
MLRLGSGTRNPAGSAHHELECRERTLTRRCGGLRVAVDTGKLDRDQEFVPANEAGLESGGEDGEVLERMRDRDHVGGAALVDPQAVAQPLLHRGGSVVPVGLAAVVLDDEPEELAPDRALEGMQLDESVLDVSVGLLCELALA